ncbi:MAG TPA: MFS transporter [Jatrophihabitans sp.]|jgi:MFS family permease
MYLTERPSSSRSAGLQVKQRVAGTVILMGLVSMFTDISSESVSAVLPLYLTAVVGLGPLAYGFIDGIYQGVSALVRILGGWLADAGDHPKWVAFSGYGLSAITRLALIPLHSFAAITAVITTDRLGKGIRTGPRDAVIAASSAPESLGRAFGVHRALDTLGAVIGPLLAFCILYVVPGDYKSVFVVSFAAAIIGLAVLLIFVPDVRPRRARAQANGTTLGKPPRPSFALLADRRFGRLVLAAGLLGILTVGDGFLYLALQHRDDMAVKYFPLLYVGTNFAYLALAVPLGRLSDRIGRAKVFLTGHLFLIAAYVCAGGPAAGAGLTIACLLLLGTYYACTDGTLAALSGMLVDPSVRASGISTAQTVQAGARFISSLGFGLIWTLAGQQSALLIVAVALAAVIPIGWLLLRNNETRPEALAA